MTQADIRELYHKILGPSVWMSPAVPSEGGSRPVILSCTVSVESSGLPKAIYVRSWPCIARA